MPYKIREKEIENWKQYFSIGEVAEIADCECSAVRFWEAEGNFKPIRKNKKGNRMFTREDLRTVVTVKLLRWHGVDLVLCREAMVGGYGETLLKVLIQLKAGEPVNVE